MAEVFSVKYLLWANPTTQGELEMSRLLCLPFQCPQCQRQDRSQHVGTLAGRKATCVPQWECRERCWESLVTTFEFSLCSYCCCLSQSLRQFEIYLSINEILLESYYIFQTLSLMMKGHSGQERKTYTWVSMQRVPSLASNLSSAS